MKKFIYIIISFMIAGIFSIDEVRAEDNYRDKTFCFVYIASSQHTAINPLIEYLDSRYERAVSMEDFVMVIYMANGSVPFIVEINTPSDNREAYADLLKELRSGRSRRVDPSSDIENIVGLFDRLDFVAPASGDLKYGAVDWHFHVTSDFWAKGYNESLISSLCFVMGVNDFVDENFRLRCYFSRYDEFEYDEEAPFGLMNFCNLEFRPYYY